VVPLEGTVDIGRYVSFIEENGSELEIARFRHLFYGVRPEPDVVQPFIELQNDDGGFPCKLMPGKPSSVNDTIRGVWWLDELGLLASSSADRAFKHLFAVQKEDGGWDENPAAAEYGMPPWASPGDLRARMYLTAQCGHWLAVRGHTRHPAFVKARDFLHAHRDEDGRFYGYLHTTWIATSAFVAAGEEYQEVVEQGLRALMAKPLSEWLDSQVSWALEVLGRVGLSKEEPFVEQGLAVLLHREEVNGRWVSEDGEAYTVNATIGALNALKRYSVVRVSEANQ
jgi:hypothetical protein